MAPAASLLASRSPAIELMLRALEREYKRDRKGRFAEKNAASVLSELDELTEKLTALRKHMSEDERDDFDNAMDYLKDVRKTRKASVDTGGRDSIDVEDAQYGRISLSSSADPAEVYLEYDGKDLTLSVADAEEVAGFLDEFAEIGEDGEGGTVAAQRTTSSGAITAVLFGGGMVEVGPSESTPGPDDLTDNTNLLIDPFGDFEDARALADALEELAETAAASRIAEAVERAVERAHGRLASSRFPAVRLLARVLEHLPNKHPQESHGGDGPASAVVDKLKGAGRIELEPGERLLRSDRTRGESGRAWLAVTEKDGKRSLRIGLGNATFGTRSDHGGPWRAGPDRTAEINEERAELRDLKEDLESEIEELEAEPDADSARLAALRNQLEEYEAIDAADVEFPNGYTALLDESSARQLRETLAKALGDGAKLQAELDKPYQEFDRLTLQRDKLKAMGRKWTDEEEAEWDRLTSEISRAETELDPSSEPERPETGYWTLAEGSIPGRWADVHYDIFLDDASVGVEVKLGAVPHGSGLDFDDMRGAEMAASFGVPEANELVRILARMDLGAGKTVESVVRMLPMVTSPAVRLMLFARALERKDFIKRGGKIIAVDRDAKGRFGDMLDGPELDAIIAKPMPGDRDRLKAHFSSMTVPQLRAEAKTRGAYLGTSGGKEQMAARMTEYLIGDKLNAASIERGIVGGGDGLLGGTGLADPKPRGASVAKALLSGDPSALDGFNREQLRREAGKRGIAIKRGAGEDEIRDALWDHERTGVDDEADLPAVEKAELDLARMTVPDLKARAKAEGVKGYSKMRKADLVTALTLTDLFKGDAPAAPEPRAPKAAKTSSAKWVGPDDAVAMQREMLQGKPWTQAELAAIGRYSPASAEMNGQLRGGVGEGITYGKLDDAGRARVLAAVDATTATMRPLPTAVKTRRLTGPEAFGIPAGTPPEEVAQRLRAMVGDRVREPGFMATSMREDWDFDAPGQIQMEIDVPRGTAAVHVPSARAAEQAAQFGSVDTLPQDDRTQELLIASGQIQEILGVEHAPGGQVRLQVRLVGGKEKAAKPSSSNMAKVTADLEALRRNPVKGDREKVAAILKDLKHAQLDQLAQDNDWQLPKGATLAQKRAQLEQHYVGRKLTSDAIFALGKPRQPGPSRADLLGQLRAASVDDEQKVRALLAPLSKDELNAVARGLETSRNVGKSESVQAHTDAIVEGSVGFRRRAAAMGGRWQSMQPERSERPVSPTPAPALAARPRGRRSSQAIRERGEQQKRLLDIDDPVNSGFKRILDVQREREEERAVPQPASTAKPSATSADRRPTSGTSKQVPQLRQMTELEVDIWFTELSPADWANFTPRQRERIADFADQAWADGSNRNLIDIVRDLED